MDDTIKSIEDQMANIIADWPSWTKFTKEYERLLDIMGNVDGPEILALTIVALVNVVSYPEIKQIPTK